jgi:hypothetical protein
MTDRAGNPPALPIPRVLLLSAAVSERRDGYGCQHGDPLRRMNEGEVRWVPNPTRAASFSGQGRFFCRRGRYSDSRLMRANGESKCAM